MHGEIWPKMTEREDSSGKSDVRTKTNARRPKWSGRFAQNDRHSAKINFSKEESHLAKSEGHHANLSIGKLQNEDPLACTYGNRYFEFWPKIFLQQVKVHVRGFKILQKSKKVLNILFQN